MIEPLMEVKDLKKYFPVNGGLPFKKNKQNVKAVDGVSFEVYPGETLGIVGESGCGKSTVARLLNRLIQPTTGEIKFKNNDLINMSNRELQKNRRVIQMIFQDPYASLDPRMNVEDLITEPMKIHKVGDKKYRKQKVESLLEKVGLDKKFKSRHPHEFSGGQRQRLNIARALVLDPEVIICDEPVSALDVSVQAQVINLLNGLKDELDLTLVFISHDLNVVRYMCDRIAVMYLGKIVEVGSYDDIYKNPSHPYTQALLSAIPKESPFEENKYIPMEGTVPSPLNPPSGCRFHPRCPFATETCKSNIPNLRNADNMNENHIAACHHIEKIKSGEIKPGHQKVVE